MDTSAASTSTSASASTATAANPNYDIFINHRGSDTKKNFASHLYRRLVLHGLQVFLDHEEMRQGDSIDSQINAAIKSTSIHVAIFSPGYAESWWCLEELHLMLRTGAPIIPVFYNIEPSELKRSRSQNGLYAQALRNHEEKCRYDSAALENWRDALFRVSDKSGFELAAFNGDEGELLEKIVECLLKKVKRLGLYVAKYPTGLDMKVKDFENTVLLQQQMSKKPQIFGIVGLGGVGKTTLAKELFNRHNSYYSNSCFLPGVRDHATRGSLNLLQSKLYNSLTKLEMEIDSIDEGTPMLKKSLSSSQGLIILDDVDDVKQVDTLLPDIQTVVRSDSLIFITSRDIAVLRSSGIQETSIYKLNGLKTEHSRELFCSHAFSQQHPLPGFESLVDKFIEACDGLPLSLTVFGALLYGKHDQSDWQNQLDSLQRSLPNDIQRRLRISYDTLNQEEQHIFLDIACFFIGENRDKAVRIWNGSGWKGLLGFQNLHDKCLVELDSRKNILMHDHLRDMGRDLANNSNLQLPRRVRCSTHNIDDLLQQSYNEQVRGIMVAPTAPRAQFEYEHPYSHSFVYGELKFNRNVVFSNMSWYKRCSHELLGNRAMKLLNSLRNPRHRFLGVDLLDVEDGDLERILTRVQSPNVIWLRWYKCPYTFLPYWIPMENLTVLEVVGDLLETLWQRESQVPLQLRVLHISAPLSNIPKSIGQLKHLEHIVLSQEVKLKTLPEEICHLQSLKTLVLKGWSSLESLPDSFGDLKNLEHLVLERKYNLERLPSSFGNLIRLKYLNLYWCEKLTISEGTLGNIRSLEYLDLVRCSKIEILPPQLALQRSLAELKLSCTDFKEWPSASASGDPSDLEVLTIESSNLRSLPPSLGELKNLKKLTLYTCRNLEYLPDSVVLLSQLTELTVRDCPLRELPFKKIEVQRQTSADSPFKEFLPRLLHLHMFGSEISEISFGEGVCPNLHDLKIEYCDTLVEIGKLPDTLVELKLRRCTNLKKIEGLSVLSKLQRLLIEP